MEKIKIKYVKSYDYKSPFSTGVYGGITGNGYINLNFYIDRALIPTYQEIALDDTSVILDETKDGDVLREVLSGAILNLETAKEVHSWLGNKISELEKILNTPIENGNITK